MRRLLLALLLIHTCTFLAPAVPNDTSPVARLGRGAMGAVDFSPDGRWFATGGQDGELNLWDNWNGSRVHRLIGYSRWVDYLRFSPDCFSLYSIGSNGNDKTFRRWDIATGKQLLCRSYPDLPQAFDFNSSGTLMVLAQHNGLIQFCNLDGEPLSTVTLIRGAIFKSVRFSPKSSYLLLEPWHGVTYIVDMQGQTVWSADNVYGIAMAPDEQSFFYCQGITWYHSKLDGAVLQYQSIKVDYPSHLTMIGYIPQTNQVIVQYLIYNDASLHLISLDTLENTTLTGPRDQIELTKLDGTGDLLQVASRDGHIWTWKLSTLELVRNFHPNSTTYNHTEFSPDGRRILLGTNDAAADEYDLNGKLINTYSPWLKLPHSVVLEAHFSDDGQLVGMTTDEGSIFIWNAQSHALLHSQINIAPISTVSRFLPGSHVLVTDLQTTESNTLIFNADTSVTNIYPLRYPHLFIGPNTYLHFILSYSSNYVQIIKSSWPYGDDQQSTLVPQDSPNSFRYALSADKKTLIISTYAGRISFVDIPSMTVTNTIRVSDYVQYLEPRFVQFLPDGNRFLIGWMPMGKSYTDQKAAELRDVRTGNLLQTFDPPGGDYCTGGDVSPDGQYAAIAQGGFTYLFRLPAPNAAHAWELYP